MKKFFLNVGWAALVLAIGISSVRAQGARSGAGGRALARSQAGAQAGAAVEFIQALNLQIGQLQSSPEVTVILLDAVSKPRTGLSRLAEKLKKAGLGPEAERAAEGLLGLARRIDEAGPGQKKIFIKAVNDLRRSLSGGGLKEASERAERLSGAFFDGKAARSDSAVSEDSSHAGNRQSQLSSSFERREAGIAGRREKVILQFNPRMRRLIESIGVWEAQLRQKGLEARFLIGAGDLRRAVLQMPADGPGDVELFLHIANRSLKPVRLTAAIQLLRDNGLDLVSTFKRLFPENKLDLFVKDEYSLKNGKPYLGELGFFDELGDTSLNQLVYSPGENLLYGDPANLEALALGSIRFTEKEKVRRLEEPASITGTGKKSDYPATILRLALRSIRLWFDLKLSPNENRLRLDGSFHEVLKGFELYFKDCASEKLAGYALPEAYVLQFLKMFRNRTPQELKTMRSAFPKEFPKTFKTFQGLGLDPELLMAGAVPADKREAVEFKAVHQNARYKALKPFISKPGMEILNPFKSAKLAKALLAQAVQKGIDEEHMKMIPEEVLKLYSPSLFHHVRHFDTLSREEKLATVQEAVAALKLFSKEAAARLFKESVFREQHFHRFSFANPSRLKPEDPRTLLEFVSAEMRSRPSRSETNPPQAGVFNRPVLSEVESRIAKARAAGKAPVLFVDLDGTVYSAGSQTAALLRRYDGIHGTSYFSGLKAAGVAAGDAEEFLYEHLAGQIRDFRALKSRVEEVKEFLKAERFKEEALRGLEVDPTVQGSLLKWEKLGARIVYVTARPAEQGAVTLESLKTDGLPAGELIVNKTSAGSARYKLEAIEEYRSGHPKTEMVLFLDDDRLNVQKIRSEMPEILAVRVLSRRDPAAVRSETFLSREDSDVYRVLAGPQQRRPVLPVPPEPPPGPGRKSRARL